MRQKDGCLVFATWLTAFPYKDVLFIINKNILINRRKRKDPQKHYGNPTRFYLAFFFRLKCYYLQIHKWFSFIVVKEWAVKTSSWTIYVQPFLLELKISSFFGNSHTHFLMEILKTEIIFIAATKKIVPMIPMSSWQRKT